MGGVAGRRHRGQGPRPGPDRHLLELSRAPRADRQRIERFAAFVGTDRVVASTIAASALSPATARSTPRWRGRSLPRCARAPTSPTGGSPDGRQRRSIEPGQVGHPHARHHRVCRRARPPAGGAGDRHRARHPGIEPVVPARHAGRARLPRARRAALFGRSGTAAAAGAQRRRSASPSAPRRWCARCGSSSTRPPASSSAALGRRGDRHRDQRAGAALCDATGDAAADARASPRARRCSPRCPKTSSSATSAKASARGSPLRPSPRRRRCDAQIASRSAAAAFRSPTRSSHSASAGSAGP